MFQFVQRLSKRYQEWVGDSDTERAVRKHLSGRGFYGDLAKFKSFRLVAVQRPGWLQVFSFEVEVRVAEDDERHADADSLRVTRFGLVRQDDRYKKCDIELFEDPAKRSQTFELWSEDLIKLRTLV